MPTCIAYEYEQSVFKLAMISVRKERQSGEENDRIWSSQILQFPKVIVRIQEDLGKLNLHYLVRKKCYVLSNTSVSFLK